MPICEMHPDCVLQSGHDMPCKDEEGKVLERDIAYENSFVIKQANLDWILDNSRH